MMQVPHGVPGNVIMVNCKWSNTANTIQAISMDEDDTSDDVLDSVDADDSMQVREQHLLHCTCQLAHNLLVDALFCLQSNITCDSKIGMSAIASLPSQLL